MKTKLVALAGSTFFLITATAASAEEYILSAELKGASEVPGPGDDDAAGTADVTLDTEKMRLCYSITIANIGKSTGAHIHSGAAGVSGAPLVMLDTPVNGTSKNCMDIPKEAADAIAANPGNFYVNVHTEDFPAGAARGQLVVE